MKEPHNYRAVGWSMVAVAAALAIIGLLVLVIGDDAYFSDKIMKQKQTEFKAKQEMEKQMQDKAAESGGMLILYYYNSK